MSTLPQTARMLLLSLSLCAASPASAQVGESPASPSESIVIYTHHSTYVVPIDPSQAVLSVRGTFVQHADGSVSGRQLPGKREQHGYQVQSDCDTKRSTLVSLVGGIGFYAYARESTCSDTTSEQDFDTIYFESAPSVPVPTSRVTQLCDLEGADPLSGYVLSKPYELKQFTDDCIANLTPELTESALKDLSKDALMTLREQVEACDCSGTWSNSLIHMSYGRVLALRDEAPSHEGASAGSRSVIHGSIDPQSCSRHDLCGSTLAFRKDTPKANPMLVTLEGDYALVWGNTAMELWARGRSQPIRQIKLDASVVGARHHAHVGPLSRYLDRVVRQELVADESTGLFPTVWLPWRPFSAWMVRLSEPLMRGTDPEPWNLTRQAALDDIAARLPALPDSETEAHEPPSAPPSEAADANPDGTQPGSPSHESEPAQGANAEDSPADEAE